MRVRSRPWPFYFIFTFERRCMGVSTVCWGSSAKSADICFYTKLRPSTNTSTSLLLPSYECVLTVNVQCPVPATPENVRTDDDCYTTHRTGSVRQPSCSNLYVRYAEVTSKGPNFLLGNRNIMICMSGKWRRPRRAATVLSVFSAVFEYWSIVSTNLPKTWS